MTESAAHLADPNSSDPPQNYLDIKIHEICNIPSNWLNDSGTAPCFNDHVFRYEIAMNVAGSQHVFKNGRVLQSIPLYTDFVNGAKLQPLEQPGQETGDNEGVITPGLRGAGAMPRDYGAEIGDRPPTPSEQQESKGTTGAGAAPGDAASLPPKILWVLSKEQDVDTKDENVGGKKDPKAAAKGKAAAAAAPPPGTVVEPPKPIAPNTSAPPQCVARIPLTLQQLAKLEETVEQALPITLTFRRVLRSNVPADWEDTHEIRFQANINIPTRKFAEPGTTQLSEEVELEPLPFEPPKEEEKGSKKKAPPKKSKGTAPACLTEDLDPNEPHPYTANHTTCKISIQCQNAIVRLPQARPRPELEPSDMIPKRMKPPRRPVEATKQYTLEVERLCHRIVADYREHLKTLPAQTSQEDSRSSFFSYLSTSGQSQAYKDLLLPTVQSIIKEKFMRKANPTKEEMDKVSNELYMYLLDHLHMTINRTLSNASSSAAGAGQSSEGGATGNNNNNNGQGSQNNNNNNNSGGGSPTSSSPFAQDPAERWKRLALEAEVMREYDLAAKYHQERLLQCRPKDGGDELPDIWCEYAEYCLRVRDALKAEQGYREALALDLCHLPSLIGYGALLLSRSRFTEAEVFFQSAVDIDGNLTTWGFLALHFDILSSSLPNTAEGDAQRTSCLRESKYAMTQATRAASASSESGGSNAPTSAPQVFFTLARHLLDLHLEELANFCLQRSNPSPEVDYAYAKLFSQTQQHDDATQILQGLIDANPNNCDARLLLGDVCADVGKRTEAEAQYDSALRISPNCGNGPAYVRLGNLYIGLGKYKDALSAFLMGAKVWPCGLTWLGVGIAYHRMDDHVRAEQALNESNILNNLNPKTWAYLALVCLRQRREDEGDQAFNQAIKQGLSDPFLIAEIGAEQLRLGRHKIAEACFRRSLTLKDDCNTRMYLAKVLLATHRHSEAREEFALVVQRTGNETQKQKAQEQMSMIPVAASN